MSKSNKTGLFVGGMLLGGAVGTLFGLLIAPRTGKETRKILKKSADALPEIAEDLSTSVQLQADRISENALRNFDDTLRRLKEALSAGIEASKLETDRIQQEDREVSTNSTASIPENN
ncbi:MAG: YtxH domain-containing protein [Prochloraceae cyanobacterium]|nr:YtxH domain-containing protein [Prochloraceae cyanobacterium]